LLFLVSKSPKALIVLVGSGLSGFVLVEERRRAFLGSLILSGYYDNTLDLVGY
jgi:hypothetical protein